MKKKIEITEARTDFENLENLGWNFDDLYAGVAAAKQMSPEEAEAWEKENYHVMLTVVDGWVYWQPCHNTSGLEGDRQQASYTKSDNEESLKHLQHLYDNALLWETWTKDDEEHIEEVDQWEEQ